MNKIKITADSTCDLSPELIEKYDISIIGLHVYLGETEHTDGKDLSNDQIFKYVDETGQLPRTAALSIADYDALFRPYTEQGYSVIHINLSSELSSSHQNACIAASELENVHVVDSRNLSTGSGHLALIAAELAAQGASASDIAETLRGVAAKVDASFILDTLAYLRKGGRCSSITALGANMLKLKPSIQVSDGKMGVAKKYRGAYPKCVEQYIRDCLFDANNISHKRIFITHANCSDEIVELAKKTVRECINFEEIFVTTAGATITSHCGPNCIGVLFIRK